MFPSLLAIGFWLLAYGVWLVTETRRGVAGSPQHKPVPILIDPGRHREERR